MYSCVITATNEFLNVYTITTVNKLRIFRIFSSWDAALKYSGVELELFDNEEMWKFLEDNIRGGVATISHRRAIANNKHMDDYNSSEPNSCLFYTDAVNMYGWAMSQYLPTGIYMFVYVV